MSDTKDIVNEVQKTVGDRINSPLFGSFFISWCALNYKILLIAVSSEHVAIKISYIEARLNINQGFWIPLGFALIYVFPFSFIRIGLQLWEDFINNLKTKWKTKLKLNVSSLEEVQDLLVAPEKEQTKADLSEEAKKLLIRIGTITEHDQEVAWETYLRDFGETNLELHPIKTQNILDQLLKIRYIQHTLHQKRGEYFFKLTADGRDFLVRNKLI